jgi:tRNA(Arg) A34 adenosine deaminase TadA
MDPSNKQQRYYEIAEGASEQGQGRSKHGSVVVKSGRILQGGWNQRLGRTRAHRDMSFRSLHSEIHACLGLSAEILYGADIYNYRRDRNGILADSQPCALCRVVLRDLGVARVFYTNRAEPHYGVVKL